MEEHRVAVTLFSMQKQAEEILKKMDSYRIPWQYGGRRKVPVLSDDKDYIGLEAIDKHIEEIGELN